MSRGWSIGVAGRQGHVRAMLERMKVPSTLTSIAAHQIMFLPQTTDPQATGVQLIVQGIQRTLKRKGYPVEVTGTVDEATAVAIRAVAGAGWRQRTWMQVAAEALEAPRAAKPASRVGVGSYHTQEPLGGILADFFWSPAGMLAVVAAAWAYSKRR